MGNSKSHLNKAPVGALFIRVVWYNLNMKKILLIILGVMIITMGVFVLTKKTMVQAPSIPIENPAVSQEGIINAVTFNCVGNKTINAIFFKDKVELALSDKRNMLIPQGISGSGARYANQDESFIFWNKGDTAFIEEKGLMTYKDCLVANENKSEETPAPVGLANPASTNCAKVGGNLVIETKPDGSQYGLCYFEDNRACEEWALLRGDCPVGGIKTTGYDTIDQKFCAWSGGSTLAVANSVCIFKDGKKCSTLDFYNGKCIDN